MLWGGAGACKIFVPNPQTVTCRQRQPGEKGKEAGCGGKAYSFAWWGGGGGEGEVLLPGGGTPLHQGAQLAADEAEVHQGVSASLG